MVKKLVAFFVLLILTFSLFSLTACNNNDFLFELINDDTAYRLYGYAGTNKNVVIPDSYNGKPVTEVRGIKCLKDGIIQDIVESLVIPASVKRINNDAFGVCSELKAVTFASGSQLEVIDEAAFYRCYKLESIEIPASVTSIGDFAFLNCHKLSSVTFASGSRLETIGMRAFGTCASLESIIIPASVISFSSSVFYNCMNLKSIFFASGSWLASLGQQPFYFCPNLTDIYFGGTEEHWNILDAALEVSIYLNPNIMVHFNWTGE